MSTYHFNIDQHSIEWHEIRWGKIGGTRAKELFVKSDTLLYKLLAEIVEPFDEDYEESYQSEAMERGNEFEPQARDEASKYTGLNFIECGWIQSENDLMGISPDGITSDLENQLEIKCPGAVAHLKMCIKNEIPIEYINQCVHAFVCNDKLKKLFFCSYRPECEIKPLFIKKLTLESLVNNGTAAKPVMVSISDLVKMSNREAEFIQEQIKENINKLSF